MPYIETRAARITRYFDMVKEVSATSRSNAILVPHPPGTPADLFAPIRNAVIVAESAGNASGASQGGGGRR